ncbi:MAG: hypothetical protein KJ559_02205 [Nanoarchaeota archaeon]|nr:hypothetical protein [Nanoarchaeota archaeon]
MEWYVYALVGALGGLVRGMFGVMKAMSRDDNLNVLYLLATVIIATLIGAGLGFGFKGDYRAAAIAGYVGTDILESVFKETMGRNIVLKKT